MRFQGIYNFPLREVQFYTETLNRSFLIFFFFFLFSFLSERTEILHSFSYIWLVVFQYFIDVTLIITALH